MKKFWIVTAMDEEAQHIIDLYGLQFCKELKNIKFFENSKIVLALTWIWKIQAWIWTAVLCMEYNVENIINIWIAGNLRWNEVKIWDVFLVNKIYQHDMYLPFSGSHLDYCKWCLEIPEYKVNIDNNLIFWITFWWVCVTWDAFMDDTVRSQQLHKEYCADVAEMEAFAVASVVREFGKLNNLYIVKAVSDWADSDAIEAHENNLDFAMSNSLEVLKRIIY